MALFSGLPPSELADVLAAAFALPPQTILGLVDVGTRAVIPLSLASQVPESLVGEGHEYDLLVDGNFLSPDGGDDVRRLQAMQQQTINMQREQIARQEEYLRKMTGGANVPPPVPPAHAQKFSADNSISSSLVPGAGDADDDLDSRNAASPPNGGDAVDGGNGNGNGNGNRNAMQDKDLERVIIAFVSKLVSKEAISIGGGELLIDLVEKGDGVVYGAYKVAEWTQVRHIYTHTHIHTYTHTHKHNFNTIPFLLSAASGR